MAGRWRYIVLVALAFAAAPAAGIAIAEVVIWAIKVKPWLVLR